MKFGLHSVNLHTCGYPETAARLARAAEAAGFESLCVPFDQRGSRGDEYLAAMRAIWTQEKPAYQGRYVSFAGVQAQPQPVQRPTPPIIVGGRTPVAFRRAVQHGHGWYGFGLDVEQTAHDIEALREMEQRYPRPAELGRLELSVTPPGYNINSGTVERYATIGVDRLILRPQPTLAETDVEQFIATTAQS